VLFNFSICLFCFSIIIVVITLFLTRDFGLNLEIPSRVESKKGHFSIGRNVVRKVKKLKFFISLNDLEKQMFICGATGTGKSNFLQNFY